MAALGVMIEAQEGLDWERWRRVVADAERLGFASLRVSDHCQSVQGAATESLQTWAALALAAEWTERIQLGPMVSPMTFYVPAVLARLAKAVDQLASGRLLLGVGAGWNQAEHDAFGIPFPSVGRRFDLLEAGIERIRRTLGDRQLPLLIGGGGEQRTLPLAARDAAEWNLLTLDLDTFAAKSALLDARCRQLGREPGEVRRSVMCGFLVGRDQAELRERVSRLQGVLPSIRDLAPEAALEKLRPRFAVGTPDQVVARLRPLAAAGVELFLLQHFLLDDGEALELLAEEVAPALA